VQDPTELFQYETDTAPQDLQASVMLVALEGFVDAGLTQKLLTDHILATNESTVVASFDVDQVLDYRGRRPVMVFDRDHWSSYDDPSLLVHRVIDRDGTPFLLVAGPEPDYQWNRMSEAMTSLIDRLGVDLTVTVHGVPMAVPHTRPIGVTAHGSNRRLLTENEPVFGTIQVPGSFPSLLELRLGDAGRDAIGFAVHVPHYLAQTEFADAALVGLERVTAATGLHLGMDELVSTASRNRAEIAKHLADSEEVAAVVAALEQQYDTFLEGRKQRSLLATELRDLPTADEIGAEFEAFLKDVDDARDDEAGEQPEA
jgi:predicted ATP-grasp superfamily ATP-dependent carboligase